MIKVRYREKRPKDASAASVLKISMWRTLPLTVDQLRKNIGELIAKVEQDEHVASRDIVDKINISY